MTTLEQVPAPAPVLVPATTAFMKHYDELAAWANQTYADCANGEITVDSLTPYIRNRMKEVWENQVALLPATAVEAVEALMPGSSRDDLLLVDLPESPNTPAGFYRIYRAPAYAEGKHWAWQTGPDGKLGIWFLEHEVEPGTIRHSWNGLTRTDTAL